MQTPIEPPYAEALSLMKNKETDYRSLINIDAAIENKSGSSISAMKQRILKDRESQTAAPAKTPERDEDESEGLIDIFQNLCIFQEDEDNDRQNDNN